MEVVNDEGDIDKGPEYHISVTRSGARCTRNEASHVIKAFGMEAAEEDNHVVSSIARHFWLPVAENLIGRECPCKETETAIIEDRGDFIWRPIG